MFKEQKTKLIKHKEMKGEKLTVLKKASKSIFTSSEERSRRLKAYMCLHLMHAMLFVILIISLLL